MNVTWVTIPGVSERDEIDPTLHIGKVAFGTFAGMASPGHTIYVAWDPAMHPSEVDAYEWRVEISESCDNPSHRPLNPLPAGVSDEGTGRCPSVDEAKAAALAWLVAFPYSGDLDAVDLGAVLTRRSRFRFSSS